MLAVDYVCSNYTHVHDHVISAYGICIESNLPFLVVVFAKFAPI